MVQELKIIDDEEFDHPCGYGWNDAPKGDVEKITEDDFQRQLSQHSPSFISHSQITDDDFIMKLNELGRCRDKRGREKHHIVDCTIFYWDDFCILIEHHFWEKSTDYWKIAPCLHEEWRELSVQEAEEKGHSHFGTCWHVEECTSCGAIRAYDSSD